MDILGIRPLAQATEIAVKKSFEGLEAFLSSVCKPALDELGLVLRDRVTNWRLNNVIKILEKSKGKMEFTDSELKLKTNPRVALSIIENGSVCDNDEIQELWAGLFVSSCTDSGEDDENLIFIDILRQLTKIEARILSYGCKTAKKGYSVNGLIMATNLQISFDELVKITGVNDTERLDRELDHLRTLGLIGNKGRGDGGFKNNAENLNATISPTSLALNLFVRCQGANDVGDYFDFEPFSMNEDGSYNYDYESYNIS